MNSGAAQSFELLLLQDAQQFRLDAEGDVADFIQKQRASICRLKSPYPLNYSTGESTSLMAEEFAFESSAGIAAQFSLTNGRVRRSLSMRMARAISSLPVPVSPWMRTVQAAGPTVKT